MFLPWQDVRKSLILGPIAGSRGALCARHPCQLGLRPIGSENIIYHVVSHRGHDGRSRAARVKPGRGLA